MHTEKEVFSIFRQKIYPEYTLIRYADGYIRGLYKKANVIVNGKLAPIVGRICMDQCMVDITGVRDARVGDRVIMFGERQDSLLGLADKSKSNWYEALCLISSRIPRVYLRDEVK